MRRGASLRSAARDAQDLPSALFPWDRTLPALPGLSPGGGVVRGSPGESTWWGELRSGAKEGLVPRGHSRKVGGRRGGAGRRGGVRAWPTRPGCVPLGGALGVTMKGTLTVGSQQQKQGASVQSQRVSGRPGESEEGSAASADGPSPVPEERRAAEPTGTLRRHREVVHSG